VFKKILIKLTQKNKNGLKALEPQKELKPPATK